MKNDESRIFQIVVSLTILGGAALAFLALLMLVYEVVKILPKNMIE